jgi:hypothetical protein
MPTTDVEGHVQEVEGHMPGSVDDDPQDFSFERPLENPHSLFNALVPLETSRSLMVPESPGGSSSFINRARPRIVGLQRQGSILKNRDSNNPDGKNRKRQLSVQFGEEHDEEDREVVNRKLSDLRELFEPEIEVLPAWAVDAPPKSAATTRASPMDIANRAGVRQQPHDYGDSINPTNKARATVVSVAIRMVRESYDQFRSSLLDGDHRDRVGTGGGSTSTLDRVFADGNQAPQKWNIPRLATSPLSAWCFYWDLLSMFFIAWDIVMVPLDVFDLPTRHLFFIATGTIAATYWSLDIARTFFTGYYMRGEIVMNLRAIAWNYARHWLVFDLMLVLCEWVRIVALLGHQQDGLGQNGMSTYMRFLRTLRAARLARTVKVGRLLKMLEDHLSSEFGTVVFRLVKLFIGIIVINHITACLWYGIGESFREQYETWTETYLKGHDDFGYRYTTSFHWSLTQFTPASISVQPHNVIERIFSIFVLLFALVFVSSFVSGITSSVIFLESLNSEKAKHNYQLRRYLRETQVPSHLAIRVQYYCSFVRNLEKERLAEGDVQLLTLLSVTLRNELNVAIFEPRITRHPLFVLIGKVEMSIMERLCSTAMSRLALFSSSTLFEPDKKIEHFYIVNAGDLMYNPKTTGNSQRLSSDRQEPVKTGMWACETALWIVWNSLGALTATSHCEIVSIEAASFSKIVVSNDVTMKEGLNYAKGFIQGFKRAAAARRHDLYHSDAIEGLWFRLINEYQVKRTDMVAASHRSSTLFDPTNFTMKRSSSSCS